jgi:ectoine hydroxylase-related dioxygenase (phytanoyl-CoA dioxygenase family)
MIKSINYESTQWLDEARLRLHEDGVFVLINVLPDPLCSELVERAQVAFERIREFIGPKRLETAGESGVVRFPLQFDRLFECLLSCPQVDQLIDNLLSPSAICHLMNVVMLAPLQADNKSTTGSLFQNSLHRDFPRFTGGVPLSVNTFYCLSKFTKSTGSTRFLVGSHQRKTMIAPDSEFRECNVEAPAGSVIVFDSTIWHGGGQNTSNQPRIGVNVQWTHHWIKQQIDLVRVLGTGSGDSFHPKVQQRLGFNSRVVASLEEYYVPPESRIYRAGQG